MVICADTSFLFSLYGNDSHTPRALSWTRGSGNAVFITELADYELGNALRFAEFSKRINPGQAAIFWAQYQADCAAGRVCVQVCNLASVMNEAKRLSATYTLTGGHRGFDVLHVAGALKLGADQFLTFDGNQKKLAKAEGLVVPL